MPDVTIRQFRSKANAVINLLGSAELCINRNYDSLWFK